MTPPQVVQPDLFSVPRARRTDPETSRQAANSISFDRLTRTQELVLNGLRAQGPATDEELLARFRSRWPSSRASDQSIRSRRAELVRKGARGGLGGPKEDEARTEVNRLEGC